VSTRHSPKQVLDALLAANRRFAEGQARHPRQSPRRRAELAQGQTPRATVIGCADSRVPPELIFDQGLGDLFVVRVAGNVVDEAVVGSVEYAVTALETGLVIVLGHADCGAVKVALEGRRHHRFVSFSLSSIATAIQPAVDRARLEANGDSARVMELAVRYNALIMAQRLTERSSILQTLVRTGQVLIVPAVYVLETGLVEPIDQG